MFLFLPFFFLCGLGRLPSHLKYKMAAASNTEKMKSVEVVPRIIVKLELFHGINVCEKRREGTSLKSAKESAALR